MNSFLLNNRVCVVTGAAGLLGVQFCEALLEAGAHVVMLDRDAERLGEADQHCAQQFPGKTLPLQVDITSEEELETACRTVLSRLGTVDVLLNNAANNPKVAKEGSVDFTHLENFPLPLWEKDLAVGLTGAFLCSKVFGAQMAKSKGGVIVNIASDLSVIAPDQRIYRDPNLPPNRQPVKPVTYSVVKSGLIGLTRYLSTYWAADGIRVNALSPGGVYTDQPADFVKRLTHLIPMGRMAYVDEYKAAIVFLCSEASKYMTGQNLVIDGGRTVW
jgi:NAD(P)-dependent dehydrogenase (short-subunit alcohol dehydrogenase family)